ncbi:unnamed protein product [Ectocarpus sp. 4 AP-2014]
MALVAKGYRVVPQALEGAGAGASRGFRHVHLKEHKGLFKAAVSAAGGEGGRETTAAFAKGTTLFVGNVDDQGGRLCRKTIEARLRRALSSCGKILHVQVSAVSAATDGDFGDTRGATVTGRKHNGAARFAHVCFSSTKGVQRALALEQLPSGASSASATGGGEGGADTKASTRDDEEEDPEEELRDENGDETCGYAALIQRHRRKFPPRQALQEEVDATMLRFEEEESAEIAQRKAMLENPEDDDGFVTVTYKRKRGRNSGGGGSGNYPDGVVAGGAKKKRKGAGELSDFYRFQMRETRREQLATLRSKFEQDKARVAKMKEQRKFRPF